MLFRKGNATVIDTQHWLAVDGFCRVLLMVTLDRTPNGIDQSDGDSTVPEVWG